MHILNLKLREILFKNFNRFFSVVLKKVAKNLEQNLKC